MSHTTPTRILLIIVLIIVAILTIHKDNATAAPVLRLKSVQDGTMASSVIIDKQMLSRVHSEVSSLLPQQLQTFIISFYPDTVFSEEFLQSFQDMSHGVALVDYLPQYSFVVQATQYQLSLVAHLPQIEQIIKYESQHKICPSVKTTLSTSSPSKPIEKNGMMGFSHSSNTRFNNDKTTPTKWEVLTVKLFKNNNIRNDHLDHYRSMLQRNQVQYKSLSQTSPNVLILLVSESDVQRAANLLAQYPTVQWIERDLDDEMIPEVKYSSSVVQSGQDTLKPFLNIGLTGKGQVIGVADTGLDTNSCYFYDPENSVPFYDDFQTPIKSHSSKHRSIEMYFGFLDKLDAVDGHGSHVCGIATGSFFSNTTKDMTVMNDHNGIAPGAKIAMFDIGCQNPDGCVCAANTPSGACPCEKNGVCTYGKLSLPNDLRAGYFSKAYDAGARIHSNSLGSGIGIPYTDKSVAIDEFTYEHDDYLIIWSAGNNGRDSGFSTLTGAHKQAKNNIVVGATANAYPGWIEKYGLYEDYPKLLDQRRNELYTMFGCGCNSASNATCSIISSLQGDCCAIMDGQNGDGACDLQLPSEVSKSPFSIALDCCQKCNLKHMEKRKQQFSAQSIASLSSLGPTMDGRTKPDVVAPGYYINSVRSHGDQSATCASETIPTDPMFHLTFKAGTSMATPAVAAAAAIVRQYFVDGYYTIDQKKVPLNPSAALVKACVISSARPLTAFSQNGKKFSSLVPFVRTFYEGHGLINLSNVLPLKTSLSLFVKDRQPITQGEQHTYKIAYKPQNSSTLSITLVWTDYPGSSFASFALVNDLDLSLEYNHPETKKSTVVWGNSRDESTNRPDRKNNVEKILVGQDVTATEFIVRVSGHLVPSGTQNYSLVISGAVFENQQVENSFQIVKANENQKDKPTRTESNGIYIPIYVLTILIAVIISLIFLSGGLLVCCLRSPKKKDQHSNLGNEEMQEKFLDSTYYRQRL